MSSGMMDLSFVWISVLLVGLVALVIWLIKIMFPQGENALTVREQGTDKSVALEIVRQRYARGEITAEEFVRLERDLT